MSIFNTKEMLEKLKYQYLIELKSAESLSKEYNCDPVTITNTLKKLQIAIRWPNKIKKVDEMFFSKIDTEAKAYFFGLLMADGCIMDKKGRSLQMSIGLQERDGYILESFAKELKYEGKVTLYKYGKEARKRIKDPQNIKELRVSSNKLCKDLMLLGCVPRKSLILKWIDANIVPNELMHHFIRGFMDGDGWITFTGMKDKTPQHTIGFIGTKSFLTGLKNYLINKFKLNDRKLCKRNNCFSLSFGGNKIVRELYSYLYKDATLFLKRKKDKFLFKADY